MKIEYTCEVCGKKYTTANGGYDNRAHVWWEETESAKISLVQGIFSKTHYALFSNAKLYTAREENSKILITKTETTESNENGIVTFSCPPVGNVLILDAKTNEKLKVYDKLNCKDFQIYFAYKDVILQYQYEYCNNVKMLTIGRPFCEGYLELEGRGRIVDESGKTKTMLIKIPKLKLLSEFSITLGSRANPTVGQLNAFALPVGSRRNKKVVDIIFLNDDIDSDI